jgi:hypothetical protein
MSDRFEDDMMEDLMADAPEGASAMDEFDEADEADEGDGFDELEDSLDDPGDDPLEESMDSLDDEDSMDAFEEAVTDALEAEDADEFWGGFGNILKKVGRGIGSVARTVAPIAKLIPLPQAQMIGRAAGLIGNVLADEGDEMDALDELADFADEEDGFDALAPAIAGVAIRGALKHQAARIPRVQRRQLVKTVSSAAKSIARKHGQAALIAVPGIIKHAHKIAVRRRLPAKMLPQLVARTARMALRSPRVLRKLATVGARLRTTARGGYRAGGMRAGRHRHGMHSHRALRTGGMSRGANRMGRSVYGGSIVRGGGAVATQCPHCRRRILRSSGPITITIDSQ